MSLTNGDEKLKITPEIDSFFTKKGDSLNVAKIEFIFPKEPETDSFGKIIDFNQAYLTVTFTPSTGHTNGYKTLYLLNRKFKIQDQIRTTYSFNSGQSQKFLSDFRLCRKSEKGPIIKKVTFDTFLQNTSMHPYFTKTDSCTFYGVKHHRFYKLLSTTDSNCRCH